MGNVGIPSVKLKADNISLNFGGVNALTNVTLEIREGEILALIGPNGAGKTSLINVISGFYRPQKGSLYFEDHQITRLPAYEITKLGISRTFQNIELFAGLTTVENLLASRHLYLKSGVFAQGIYFGKAHKEELKHRRMVEEIIDFLEMEAIRDTVVGMLPYGLRKRVELGRALAIEPKLLLLDEPMAGMSMEEKEDMVRFILDVYEDKKITILLVEHDMGVVMDIADRAIVFDFGQKIAEGPPKTIRSDSAVIRAYLGEDEAAF